MANAVALAGLCGASQAILEGSFVNASNARVLSCGSSGSSKVSVCARKPAVVVSVAHESEEMPAQSRRSMLSLLAAAVAGSALATEAKAATSIKVEGPPAPSGGLPGTENADQARDTDLPLKERFYLQPLTPDQAASRAKSAAQDIIDVKSLIDKKAWPYVQNGLRSTAGYLRYDLNTVILSKSGGAKKDLKALSARLFDSLNALDYAARAKSTSEAEKFYSQTVTLLNDVLSKIA